jgi:hypothetical protein
MRDTGPVTKPRRSGLPDRTSKTDAASTEGARTTRTTIEVRPSWLEDSGEDAAARRSQSPRTTIEVRPSWLEDVGTAEAADPARASSVPFDDSRRKRERPTRRLKPPPLPVEPTEEEDAPSRSAVVPPPLPSPTKKR